MRWFLKIHISKKNQQSAKMLKYGRKAEGLFWGFKDKGWRNKRQERKIDGSTKTKVVQKVIWNPGGSKLIVDQNKILSRFSWWIGVFVVFGLLLLFYIYVVCFSVYLGTFFFLLGFCLLACLILCDLLGFVVLEKQVAWRWLGRNLGRNNEYLVETEPDQNIFYENI